MLENKFIEVRDRILAPSFRPAMIESEAMDALAAELIRIVAKETGERIPSHDTTAYWALGYIRNIPRNMDPDWAENDAREQQDKDKPSMPQAGDWSLCLHCGSRTNAKDTARSPVVDHVLPVKGGWFPENNPHEATS
jgi:hypothetical protein